MNDNPLDQLDREQRFALLEFKAKNGLAWRSKLLLGWERASYAGPLQRIRNDLGPEWLATLKKVHLDAPWAPPLTKIAVTVEGLDDGVSILAYTTGAKWPGKGFEQPFFTIEAMRILATHLPDVIKEVGDGKFLILDEAYDEPRILQPEHKEVDGTSCALYSVDDWCWCRADESGDSHTVTPAPRARL